MMRVFFGGINLDRASFFIDGYNVYHSIIAPVCPKAPNGYRKYLWLNYRSFAARKISGRFSLADIWYFSAYATWRPDSYRRHQIYVKALESVGIKIVMGKFKDKDIRCRLCRQMFQTKEEKRTDVNIATHILKEAALNKYDVAILVTNDTDLIPAVEAIRTTYPKKQIGVLFPFNRKSSELLQYCDFHIAMREKDLRQCQFPDQILLPDGSSIQRPNSYR